MKVYLTMGPDGRILVDLRVELDGLVGYVLHYVGPGEEFAGVAFDQLAQSTPGSMDLPEQQDGSEVEPDTSQVPQDPQQQQDVSQFGQSGQGIEPAQ